ncbi:MAG TPA: hypothetical protein VJU79_09850, partial [Candidatus Dormibacteraeota bacterium]|nr:hypothetical protein [Candidatus Dormibacteraeota bacterium]
MSAGVADSVRHVVEATGLDGLTDALGSYIAAQRWSGGRGGRVSDVDFVDAATIIDADDCSIVFSVVHARVGDRELRFALPVGMRHAGDPLAERAPAFMIGEVRRGDRDGFAYDAVGDPAYIAWLWKSMREGSVVPTGAAELRFDAVQPHALSGPPTPDVRWPGTEQTNTSVVLDDSVFLKHLRRIEDGPSHELQMAEALSAAGFEHLAPTLALATYAPHGQAPCLLAIAQPWLRNAADGWALALTSLRDLYADAEEADLSDPLQRNVSVDEQGGAFTAEA